MNPREWDHRALRAAMTFPSIATRTGVSAGSMRDSNSFVDEIATGKPEHESRRANHDLTTVDVARDSAAGDVIGMGRAQRDDFRPRSPESVGDGMWRIAFDARERTDAPNRDLPTRRDRSVPR